MAGEPKPELAHPLCGADLGTLFSALVANGGVTPRRLPQAAIALLAATARVPSTVGETLMARRILARSAPMPDPVFIIGHWRSGTTHLQNILAHGDFGSIGPLDIGLPWDLLGLVRLTRPLLERALPDDRYIDRIPVTPQSPQEDEIGLAAMTRLSYYQALYFPKDFDRQFDRAVFLDGASPREVRQWERVLRLFLGKVWLAQGRRRLLVKNPVYTARLAQMAKLFPGASFIHIVRNPYEVFVSTRNFYRILLPQLALQDFAHVDIDALVLRTFTRMMAAYERDRAAIDLKRLVEVRYEDLDSDPMATVQAVYAGLGWPGFEAAEPAFSSYLASIRSYEKNQFAMAPDDHAKVRDAWGPVIERWGYAEPPIRR